MYTSDGNPQKWYTKDGNPRKWYISGEINLKLLYRDKGECAYDSEKDHKISAPGKQ